MFVFAAHSLIASPGGKLSSVARLMRNAGGNVRQKPKNVPILALDKGKGTQFILYRSASPAFLIRPFGAPSPRGKVYKYAAQHFKLRFVGHFETTTNERRKRLSYGMSALKNPPHPNEVDVGEEEE